MYIYSCICQIQNDTQTAVRSGDTSKRDQRIPVAFVVYLCVMDGAAGQEINANMYADPFQKIPTTSSRIETGTPFCVYNRSFPNRSTLHVEMRRITQWKVTYLLTRGRSGSWGQARGTRRITRVPDATPLHTTPRHIATRHDTTRRVHSRNTYVCVV